MRRILIGVVTGLALTGAVSAAPGGHGNDRGNDRGEAAHGNAGAEPGGGKERGGDRGGAVSMETRGPQEHVERGHSKAVARREEKEESRPAMRSPVRPREQKLEESERARGHPRVAERKAGEGGPGKGGPKAEDKERGFAGAPRQLERKDLKHAAYRGPGGREFIVPTDDRVRVLTGRRDFDWGRLYRRSDFDGCPPGLARKYNGCMPPGLAKQSGYSWFEPAWYLRDYDRTYRYRYLDGYMLRLGAGDSVVSYIPLLGGALALGQVWPTAYEPMALPPYYDDYYDLGPADSYRYYDDAIYRVDPDTAAIESVAALLTGNNIAIGEPMPPGYDIYNVPYGYRDQYYDGPDALYRYSDGYVYQLDPTTRLVQAAIELLS